MLAKTLTMNKNLIQKSIRNVLFPKNNASVLFIVQVNNLCVKLWLLLLLTIP